MNSLKTLVKMQLRDKIDFSWVKNKKEVLRKSIFAILQFAIITALIYIILFIFSGPIGLFTYDESAKIMILIMTICLTLSFISCTAKLMKNLYFSDDNRVLITFPVNANKIFVSKIIVYYIYELKKSFSFLIPLTFGCMLLLFTRQYIRLGAFLWMIPVLLIVIAIPVLLGAIFSIPAMWIYRFLKKSGWIEITFYSLILIAGLIGIIYLIGLIPDKIDFINQWPYIKSAIHTFLMNVEKTLVPFRELVYTIIGTQRSANGTFHVDWWTLVRFACLLGTCGILLGLNFLLSRPLFFKMMSKNFELKKNKDVAKKNKKHGKYFTFVNKEFLINLRCTEISVNYLAVYVLVPILIWFLNAVYRVMDLREFGRMLIYSFNILLTLLPLLASNALIATYYSREGRAGYMKKTKPVNAAYPLLAKLTFNVLFSIPSVLASCIIIGIYTELDFVGVLLLFLMFFFVHVGHMLYSAMLDVMHPQNEQYATVGEEIDNPNENKSTAVAFITAFVYGICSYKILADSLLLHNSYTFGLMKMMLVSLVLMIGTLVLFLKRIKAYYYDL